MDGENKKAEGAEPLLPQEGAVAVVAFDGVEAAPEPEVKKLPKKDPLSRQQINQAKMDIEDLHPLRERAKFDHILPFLRCCRRWIKKEPSFDHGLRKTLLAEIGGRREKENKATKTMETVPNIKIPKSEVQLLADPFLMLGYGINAYFDILRSLFMGMALISIFISPLLYGFSHNSVLGLQNHSKYFFNKFSMGNLGGAQVTCANFKI